VVNTKAVIIIIIILSFEILSWQKSSKWSIPKYLHACFSIFDKQTTEHTITAKGMMQQTHIDITEAKMSNGFLL
jgi:hypothetical protein